jgi:hypothetical protein
MQLERTALVVFAAAILFSMVREWNAPVVCSRPPYSSTASAPASPQRSAEQ